MERREQLRTLGARLSLVIVGLVLAMAVLLLAIVPAQVKAVATDWAARRAEGVGTTLALAVQPGVEFDDGASVAELLQGIGGVDDVIYGVVVDHNGKELGRWLRPGVDVGVDFRALHPATGRSAVTEHGALHLALDVMTKDPGLRGRLYLGFSLSALDREVSKNFGTVVVVALIIVLLGIGTSLIVGARLTRPLRHLAEVTTRLIAAGDLRAEVEVGTSTEEFGLLARSFREMVARLRGILLELRETAHGLPNIAQTLSMTAQEVVSGASTVTERAQATSAATEATLASVSATTTALGRLDDFVSKAQGHVSDMERHNGTVSQQVTALVSSVDDAVGAVEQTARAVEETAVAVKAQDEAMTQMLRAVRAVEQGTRDIQETAAHTAEAATETQAQAKAGVESIEHTVTGIAEIHAASQTAAQLIRELDARMSRIDTIIDVIRDVADKTTLFSLNVAILSAQAGEQGHAFSVIGKEIKALAQRTTSSTAEIAQLLAEIQDQSQRARHAMEQGMGAVDDGIRRAERASAALERILSAADRAVTGAHVIAQATGAQVRGHSDMSAQMQRIADSIRRISTTTEAQTTQNDRMRQIAKQMRLTTKTVEASTREQQPRVESVRRALDEVGTTMAAVRDTRDVQTSAARRVLDASDEMSRASEQQVDAARALDDTIAQLQARAAVLQQHLSRFRL